MHKNKGREEEGKGEKSKVKGGEKKGEKRMGIWTFIEVVKRHLAHVDKSNVSLC